MSSRLIALFKRAFGIELKQTGEKYIPTKEEISKIINGLNDLFRREKEEAGLFTTEVVLVQGIYYEAEIVLNKRYNTKYTNRLSNKIALLRSYTINKANYFRKIRELLKTIYIGADMCKRFDQNMEKLKQETDQEERIELLISLRAAISFMDRIRGEEDKLEESIGVLRNDTKAMRNIIKSRSLEEAMISVRSLRPTVYKKIKRDIDHIDHILKKEQIRIPAIRRKVRMLEKREKRVVELMKKYPDLTA